MGVLNRREILDRIRNKTEYDEKLIVTPLLSIDQIGEASVDIRLGSTIIVPKKTYIESQDITDKDQADLVERRRYDRIRLGYHSKFVLHPNELILGGTFEYISLPEDIFATLDSRSSWGRLGLVVATASVIQPGFKGCLTLELVNLSESPVVLYPGLLVGQLVFYDVTMPDVPKKAGIAPQPEDFVIYKGRYLYPTEAGLPHFKSKNSLDFKEMDFWRDGK